MKRHFCAVWPQVEKSKILVGRIRVKHIFQFSSKVGSGENQIDLVD